MVSMLLCQWAQLHTSTHFSKKCCTKKTSRNCTLRSLGKSPRQPIQAFVQSFAFRCTCRLDKPLPSTQCIQAKFLSHFGGTHCTWQVLLVRKHQQHRTIHVIIFKHPKQFFFGVLNAIAVAAVDNEDCPVCTLIIISPKRTDLVLTTDVPNSEADVFVFECFHIEAYRWACCYDLASFKLYNTVVLPAASRPIITIF